MNSPGVETLSGIHLSKTFHTRSINGWRVQKDAVRAVSDVSLTVTRGQIIAVVGESGSGKSTLGRILLGVERPDSGRVEYCGEDLMSGAAASLQRYRRSVQVVFQDPTASMNPRMNVRKIVSEPLERLAEMSPDSRDARVDEALRRVELPSDAADRYPHQFSVGQRQRIAIARAISVEPSFIVLDEPVSSLDVSVAANILSLIESLRDDLDVGMVLITHHLAHVWRLADEVLVMKAGEIVEQGDVDSIFRLPRHGYTVRLLDAMPTIPESLTP